jgi:hypothetical protein
MYWRLILGNGQMEKERWSKPIRTANAYISTVEQGAFVICDHDPDWEHAYNKGFAPLLKVWSYMNNYTPKQ